jgi:hypothetical protein
MKLTHEKWNLASAEAENSSASGHGLVVCPLLPWMTSQQAVLQARIYRFAYECALNQRRLISRAALSPMFNPSWN